MHERFSSDFRAKLEIAIDKVINAIRLSKTFSRHNHAFNEEDGNSSSVTTSDNEDEDREVEAFVNASFDRHSGSYSFLERLRSDIDRSGGETRTGTGSTSAAGTWSLRDEVLQQLGCVGLLCHASQSFSEPRDDACVETVSQLFQHEGRCLKVERRTWNRIHSQHGDEFANSPARKLSQSFSLDVVGGKPITIKQVRVRSLVLSSESLLFVSVY